MTAGAWSGPVLRGGCAPRRGCAARTGTRPPFTLAGVRAVLGVTDSEVSNTQFVEYN